MKLFNYKTAAHAVKNLSAFFLFFLILTSQTHAASDNQGAIVIFVSGDVFHVDTKGKKNKLKIGASIQKNESIVTENGKVRVQVAQAYICHLSSYTKITFDELQAQKEKLNVEVNLEYGQIYSKLEKGDTNSKNLRIKTATVVAAVRGTEFLSSQQNTLNQKGEDSDVPDGIFVNKGEVSVELIKSEQQIMVSSGEQVVATGEELRKEIMEKFIQKKMEIFKHLELQKEKNLKMLQDQKEKGESLLDSVK